MSLHDQSTLRVLLYEGPGSQAWADEERFDLLSQLLEQGYSLTRRAGTGAVAPAQNQPMLLVGRFGQAGPPELVSDRTDHLRVQDVEGKNVAEVVEEVGSARQAMQAAEPGAWKPWFPVIDFDRCTNCMQCLSFCLFGVYGVDGEQRIQVQNNEQCKTNCPACSRVCPEAAIMFPKYKTGPINGDVVSAEDLEREKMKIDISSLLGGDIYSMLRDRTERAKSRFSKERDADKALNERQKCLTKLAQEGDIPAEVLMSLPSPEEIQARAEVAKAKAKSALEGRSPE